MAFCASQSLFKRYTVAAASGGSYRFDISNVPEADGLIRRLYVSARKEPASWTGCSLSEYESFDGFASYEIIPQGSEFEITLATI